MSGMGWAMSVPTTGPVVLPLSEAFGPTYQGEGPATGRRCYFVRLGLCNLACEWCDTPYTWDTTRYDVAAECPDTPVAAILTRLEALGARPGELVVLSGGEPLMHHPRLPHLLDGPYEWHVETNGTIPPPPWWGELVTHTTVSPKLITADPARKRLKPRALTGWAQYARDGAAVFKVVVKTPEDVAAAAALGDTYGVPRAAVWVMPEGTTPTAVLEGHRTIIDAALEHGVSTTTRLHTLLWGEKRGH